MKPLILWAHIRIYTNRCTTGFFAHEKALKITFVSPLTFQWFFFFIAPKLVVIYLNCSVTVTGKDRHNYIKVCALSTLWLLTQPLAQASQGLYDDSYKSVDHDLHCNGYMLHM